ncbi:serine/threonine protein kinase [Micromonospora sp. C28ISP2-4]|uniref:serine/threonine protein kinase n=1 Tax=Micromonospora sp. C28ISP2-4 TaxID=3059523 RepID=UPI002674BF17|nr:serine/threonine protein kinase [Micromonospora sp. C28ISP2-4]MDO3686158.1 serine/threonine protein kinase [Micromonospora sp. C28ISP2-4]
MWELDRAAAFVVFGDQDSGCVSYGVESAGRRWFVKRAGTPSARESLTRALGLHAAVRHPAVVRPELVRDGTDGPTLVYPWCDGVVLNHATTGGGSDPTGLARFRRYLSPEELTRGATIDERTTVHALGRTLHHLLDGPSGWRGTAAERAVADRAGRPDPAERHATVAALVRDWRTA